MLFPPFLLSFSANAVHQMIVILVQPIAAAAVDRSVFSGFCTEPAAGNAEICRAAGAQNLLPVFFEHGRIENYRIKDQTLGLFAVFINRQVLLGSFFGRLLPVKMRESLYGLFGYCSIIIGIILLQNIKSMPAVTLALILGTIIGEALRIEDQINFASLRLIRSMRSSGLPPSM